VQFSAASKYYTSTTANLTDSCIVLPPLVVIVHSIEYRPAVPPLIQTVEIWLVADSESIVRPAGTVNALVLIVSPARRAVQSTA
jgi:hypothetical protein